MHKSGGLSSSSSSRSSLNSSMTPSWNDSIIFKLPTDEELRKEGTENLLKRLRFMEVEMKKILNERSHIIKDTNQCIQHNGMKIRKLDEFNQRLILEKKMLLFEKEELKGLCCFLDDDRSKANKVAREWQMFGRYATSYLQKEVASYQNKIKDLEQRQIALIQDNKNLKEICLLLDNHETTASVESSNPPNSHLSVSCTRDSGDGSSNGSTTGSSSPDHRSSNRSIIKDSLYSSDPAQGTRYIRYLEHKVRHLEEESKGRIKIVQPNLESSKRSSSSSNSSVAASITSPTDLQTQQPASVYETHLPKPVHLPSQKTLLKPCTAPKSLKSASNDFQDQHLDEKERANVQNVCNTVWKKFFTTNQPSYLPNKPKIPKTPSISDL